MARKPPLRLFWWNKTANFGDGISPVVVAYASGRQVEWAAPEEAEIFAVGSIMRVVARNFKTERGHRPVIWGSGCMKPVGRKFTSHVDFAALRGPRSAEALRVEPQAFGDPGILIRDALGEHVEKSDEVAVVPHHAQRGQSVFVDLLAETPGVRLIDVTEDPLRVVRRIAECRHVISSSLHGLVIADAFGVANTWMDPEGIHAEARFKFHDYAAAIGRTLDDPIQATDIPGRLAHLTDETPVYAPSVEKTASDLKTHFPQALAA